MLDVHFPVIVRKKRGIHLKTFAQPITDACHESQKMVISSHRAGNRGVSFAKRSLSRSLTRVRRDSDVASVARHRQQSKKTSQNVRSTIYNLVADAGVPLSSTARSGSKPQNVRSAVL
ncbi:hypothetical protein AVEN_203537-1 [Araneus ventricosus]|uniref:Uncharacterized protein n=1 Tax=Araneus ventricosus TaxID=182803 RepID=A0A4Y2M1H3_ARAVE|nr:hypothetical protein AVEN_203537-1 [Araneus ventricosus]